jgi:hypothetical protein
MSTWGIGFIGEAEPPVEGARESERGRRDVELPVSDRRGQGVSSNAAAGAENRSSGSPIMKLIPV